MIKQDLINKIKKVGKTIFAVALIVLFCATAAHATGLNFRLLLPVGAGTTAIYDDSGVGNTYLPSGYLVQVIQAVGSVDPPDTGNAHAIGGNDVWVADIHVGDGVGGVAGALYYSNGSLAGGNTYYLRAWQGTNYGATVNYGDSATHTVPTGNPPPPPEDWDVPSFATTDNPSTTNPQLNVNPTSRTFNATEGGANPANQTVTISNTGTGTLNWNATEGETWLSINPANGSCPPNSTLTISVNIAGLTAGTYNGTINITSNGGNSNVAVTLNVSGVGNNPPNAFNLLSPADAATNVSTTPTLDWEDATDPDGDTVTYTLVVSENSDLSSPVVNQSGLTASTYNIATALTDNTVYYWRVTADDGNGGTRDSATWSFGVGSAQPPTAVLIDDYEGGSVNPGADATWGEDPGDDDYFVFSANEPGENPTIGRESANVNGGNYAINITYPASTGWGRGFGGILASTIDLSTYDRVSFYILTTNDVTLKFQLKDSDDDVYASLDQNITGSTSWQEVSIDLADIDNPTNGGNGLNLAAIIEYQFVFSGASASPNTIYIDDVTARQGGGQQQNDDPLITDITPDTGYSGIQVTLTGENFGTGGRIEFVGVLATTSIYSTDNPPITSWSEDEITFMLPTIAAGQVTVQVIRDDNEASNTVTFTVLASGDTPSYPRPNPFNPNDDETTTIVFTPPAGAQNITGYIFDTAGRVVDKLPWTPGLDIVWDGKTAWEENVGDGVYLYRIVNMDNKSVIARGKILVINR